MLITITITILLRLLVLLRILILLLLLLLVLGMDELRALSQVPGVGFGVDLGVQGFWVWLRGLRFRA